jgi:hypothetical protein
MAKAVTVTATATATTTHIARAQQAGAYRARPRRFL